MKHTVPPSPLNDNNYGWHVGDMYRLYAKSDTDTAIVAETQTLSNSIKMPSIRISIVE